MAEKEGFEVFFIRKPMKISGKNAGKSLTIRFSSNLIEIVVN